MTDNTRYGRRRPASVSTWTGAACSASQFLFEPLIGEVGRFVVALAHRALDERFDEDAETKARTSIVIWIVRSHASVPTGTSVSSPFTVTLSVKRLGVIVKR